MLPPPGPHPGTPGPPHTGSALSPPPHLCLPPGPKLTLFTGSFHPWHEGHGRCVALASVPNLIIAPDHNPWKREIPPPFSVLRIIPLSGDTRLFVGFLGPKGPGRPTLSWVQTLVGLGFEVSLVLGDDCFDHIHRWHGAPTLLGLLSGLIIIPRLGGEGDFKAQRERLLNLNPNLVIQRRAHHDAEALSSRALRRGCSGG